MNYYNDNDPFMANWIRCLIRDGFIPPGKVDERDIKDVQPQDLEGYTQCHFFAGIAGWPFALKIAGWPPNEPVWTGSCPCQPLSVAGKQLGEKDERHLWPEFYRLISQCRPVRIFGEQSESPDGIEWLDGISLDLEEIGYAVGSVDLPSASVGAPNKRQRAWWVADANVGSRFKGEPRTNQRGLSTKNGSYIERLAHSKPQHNGAWEPRPARWREFTNGGPDGRMANAMSAGRSTRGAKSGNRSPTLCGSDGRMGNTENERLRKKRECFGRSETWTAWSESQPIQCRDKDKHGRNKCRRIPIEPALFPLAPRIPGRVGLLRGAGNAINPWVAAEFIKAFMET